MNRNVPAIGNDAPGMSYYGATRLAGVIVCCVILGACGDDADPQQQARPAATTTAVDPAAQIECSNVERAYNAWHWEPKTSADWSLPQVKMRVDDGEAFHDSVEGYTDQPALDLVVAIAEYNYQLALVNADLTINGSADTAAAESARAAVGDSYEAFKRGTCQ